MSARSLAKRVKLWPWGTIVRIGGIALGALLVLWLFWRLFILPGQLRTEAQQAKQDAQSSQGETNVTRNAMEVMENRTEYHNTVREITRSNTREILAAPGAQDRINPAVHDAGIDAIRVLREAAGQRNDQADRLPQHRP